MTNEAFLKEYLYGPAKAESGSRFSSSTEPTAIPGRRATGYLAKRFSQILMGRMTEVLEPHGLVTQQWGIMGAIAREPGTDQRRVAERQSIDVNSTSRLIDELEALGMVRRMNAPNDRRVNLLELTPEGQQWRTRLRDSVIAAQDQALACLDPTEKATLLDLLSRVVESNVDYGRPGVGRRKRMKKETPLSSDKAV